MVAVRTISDLAARRARPLAEPARGGTLLECDRGTLFVLRNSPNPRFHPAIGSAPARQKLFDVYGFVQATASTDVP